MARSSGFKGTSNVLFGGGFGVRGLEHVIEIGFFQLIVDLGIAVGYERALNCSTTREA
jgi:hypothetical protein